MRNIMEYPVTREEVMVCLDTLIQRADDDAMLGSLDGMILEAVAGFIDASYAEFEDWLTP